MESLPKQSILIIDDSRLELENLRQILVPTYEVYTATSADEGMEVLSHTLIDLILLDIIMEDVSGFDVLRRLKADEIFRHIPVIFITSLITIEDEARGLSLGAVDYIRKPLSEEVVLLRVGVHLHLLKQMRIIERYGLIDRLTCIGNRRSFDQELKREWIRIARNGGEFSMMMLDIDNFKSFNDTFGHFNGDKCIKTIAEVITGTIKRSSDVVFRWGGEEFCVILPDTPQVGASKIANEIRENIEKTPIVFDVHSTYVTVSIGVCTTSPRPNTYPDVTMDFCEHVNKTMFKAKLSGRNTVKADHFEYDMPEQ